MRHPQWSSIPLRSCKNAPIHILGTPRPQREIRATHIITPENSISISTANPSAVSGAGSICRAPTEFSQILNAVFDTNGKAFSVVGKTAVEARAGKVSAPFQSGRNAFVGILENDCFWVCLFELGDGFLCCAVYDDNAAVLSGEFPFDVYDVVSCKRCNFVSCIFGRDLNSQNVVSELLNFQPLFGQFRGERAYLVSQLEFNLPGRQNRQEQGEEFRRCEAYCLRIFLGIESVVEVINDLSLGENMKTVGKSVAAFADIKKSGLNTPLLSRTLWMIPCRPAAMSIIPAPVMIEILFRS